MENYYGTLRIKQKNLSKPKIKAHYDSLIAEGWIYAPGCGRFRKEVCTCSKCRKLKNNEKAK